MESLVSPHNELCWYDEAGGGGNTPATPYFLDHYDVLLKSGTFWDPCACKYGYTSDGVSLENWGSNSIQVGVTFRGKSFRHGSCLVLSHPLLRYGCVLAFTSTPVKIWSSTPPPQPREEFFTLSYWNVE